MRSGERPQRDVVFSAVVQEEVGGDGAIYWTEHLDYPVELVIVGEPSGNRLALGHRGILQVWATFPGRSVHASAPERGDNPNYALAAFLCRLEASQHNLKSHPVLGPTTIAPTVIEVDTTSNNVTPAWARVLLDIRSGIESPAGIERFIRKLAGNSPVQITYAFGEESASSEDPITGFYTEPEQPVVGRVQSLLGSGMGHMPELIRFQFATDGRHYAVHGLTVLGFAPGEEDLAHTVRESISLDEMAESLRGHVALLREF
ncbi:MAG: M20/M25/M40 family metallo-hydrolase [Chloroflexota bacterium]